MLEKYADANVLSDMIVHDEIDKKEKVVTFKPCEVDKMLGITISEDDMKKELERLDFKYKLDKDKFIVTIPNRRLDIDPNVNDIAEEIGRLYGYHNLVSTLPKVEIKKGEYVGNVKYRKLISKRLRSLGLNEVKTYTLVSRDMLKFNYENKENIILPNPMSSDKEVIRTTLIPSLLNVYNYNKTRKVNDILIYEIAKTYDKDYNEDSKICILMKGNYINNNWNNTKIKIDFYLIKGILENLLDYLGLKNRYNFQVSDIPNMHPGMSAKILLDRNEIGIIGRIHPNDAKDEIYICELSMDSLVTNIKPIKYKEVSKYPSIIKDMAFIMPKEVEAKEVLDIIKKSGGRLLTDINIFDVYEGEHVLENEKSIAYSLTFNDSTKTLTDEEVNTLFEKIIKDVENKGYKLRNM